MGKMLKGFIAVIFVAFMYITIIGCGGGSIPTLESIEARPSQIELDNRGMQQLDIIAKYSDGTTKNVTEQCTYQSSNEEMVTVSMFGYIKGLIPGGAMITIIYTEEDITKTTTVPVGVVDMMP